MAKRRYICYRNSESGRFTSEDDGALEEHYVNYTPIKEKRSQQRAREVEIIRNQSRFRAKALGFPPTPFDLGGWL